MHDDIIDHIARDSGYNKGYREGKDFTKNLVLELMDEVICEYRAMARSEKMDSESGRVPKAQLNAVEFMKSWVMTGGHEDFEGNRVCLPW